MKAFASDFDGTLYFPARKDPISMEDVSAIHEFQSKGYAFGFCTGRTISGLLEYTGSFLRPDFYITNSGACIYDKERNIIFEKVIPKQIVDEIIPYGMKVASEVDIHMDGDYFAFSKPDSYTSNVLKTLDDVCGHVHNISFAAGTRENASKLAAEFNEKFHNQAIAFQNVDYVDIAPSGCSKGTGIKFVRNYLNIDTFAGIGDSMNDLPMLETVDLPFTFTDSPEILQKKASHIIHSVAEALTYMV